MVLHSVYLNILGNILGITSTIYDLATRSSGGAAVNASFFRGLSKLLHNFASYLVSVRVIWPWP